MAGKRERARRSLMVADWQPSPDLQRWCREHGLSDDQVAYEVEGFVDYWLSEGDLKADWSATFRGRIRRGLETGRIRPQERQREQARAAYQQRRREALAVDDGPQRDLGQVLPLFGGGGKR